MLIKNCKYLVTQNKNRDILEDIDILIDKNGIIKDIDHDLEDELVVDASNQIIIPGLINCHNHLAMVLMRGIDDDLSLIPWLEEKIWPLEKRMTPELVYAGSLLGLAEMAKSGTTTFLDAYFFMEQVSKAVDEIGLRATLGSFYLDYPTPETDKPFDKSIELIEKNLGSSKISWILAPHAPYTCSEKLLRKTKLMSDYFNVPITMHLAETPEETMKLKYLDSLNLLNGRLILAHGTYLTGAEIGLVKGINIIHNPNSNLKFGYNIAPLKKLKENGARIGLGTDSAASNNSLDMFSIMKNTILLQKLKESVNIFSAQDIFDMATLEGAKILGLEDKIGNIECGKEADLVFLDAYAINLQPLLKERIISHLVYSANPSNIIKTMVKGKFININFDEIYKEIDKIKEFIRW